MISIYLFCYYEQLFILMMIVKSLWMIGTCLMKQHYLKKKNFKVTCIWKKLNMQIICIEKEFVEILQDYE